MSSTRYGSPGWAGGGDSAGGEGRRRSRLPARAAASGGRAAAAEAAEAAEAAAEGGEGREADGPTGQSDRTLLAESRTGATAVTSARMSWPTLGATLAMHCLKSGKMIKGSPWTVLVAPGPTYAAASFLRGRDLGTAVAGETMHLRYVRVTRGAILSCLAARRGTRS